MKIRTKVNPYESQKIYVLSLIPSAHNQVSRQPEKSLNRHPDIRIHPANTPVSQKYCVFYVILLDLRNLVTTNTFKFTN